MRVCDDGVEGLLDPIAIFIGNRERRQQLDRVIAVSGDLRQHFMIAKQRDGDELAEQS